MSGGTIASYEYRQGTSETITGDFLNIGLVSTITLTGLQNGVLIFFEIRALNEAGAGVATKGSATPLGLPGTPRALTSIVGEHYPRVVMGCLHLVVARWSITNIDTEQRNKLWHSASGSIMEQTYR